MIFGYARVSTDKQDIRSQVERLEKHGCEKIFQDVQSGRDVNRPEFDIMINQLRPRDEIVVARLDRMGRTTKQLFELLNIFKAKDINFVSLDEKIDISTAMGSMLFNMCSIIAEMEANAIRERTMAGIASARARGKFGGRPKKLSANDKALFAVMVADITIPVKDICERFQITNATYYNYCKSMKLEHNGYVPFTNKDIAEIEIRKIKSSL